MCGSHLRNKKNIYLPIHSLGSTPCEFFRVLDDMNSVVEFITDQKGNDAATKSSLLELMGAY